MTGDPLSKIWIPFGGLRGKGRCCKQLLYKWRLIGSPFASNKFTDPVDFHCQSPTQTEIHRSLFALNTGDGRFIGGDFEGLWQIAQNLYANAWIRGSWTRFTGKGTSDLTVLGSTVISNTGGPGLAPGELSVDHSTLTNAWYAVGLSLDLAF